MKTWSARPTTSRRSWPTSRSGAADAGFVYITDADSAKGKVKVVEVPAKAKPGRRCDVIAVVEGAPTRPPPRRRGATVLSAKGQAALHAAGFGHAPK